MPPFVPLAERIVDALLASDPELASSVGEHGFDDQLPDRSADAVAGRVAMLRDAAHALSEVDAEELDVPEQVDHAVLTALVDRGIFELTEVRSHEWNPLVHNPGPLLHALVARPFAPAEVRLTSLAGRLAAVPDALATARAVLHDVPRIHAETAVGQFEGAATLVRDQVPALLAEAPELRDLVEPVAGAAIRELTGFAERLRAGLRDDAGPGRDPRLGRRLWEARLWHTLDTELGARQVLDSAWANLERVTEEIRAAAVELVGGPASDETVRQALALLADEHPDNSSVVPLARTTLDEVLDFVADTDLVSLVDDACVIREMPEHDRGSRSPTATRRVRWSRRRCRRTTASRRPRRTGRRPGWSPSSGSTTTT
ncbi:hypothetical protein GCM10027615_03130 [Plantactinospora veratri]